MHIPRLQLSQLFKGIHGCRLCQTVVPSEVPRSICPNWSTNLVLMAQAPSEHGVRVSGVHWVDHHGKLRPPGGTYLDGFLRRIGYSIDPNEDRLPRPYTTNVLQCWPGKGTKRDRTPSPQEITNCCRWWQAELQLLRPVAVILLGKPAADAFVSACRVHQDFSSLLEMQGMPVSYSGGTVPVFTVPHPTAPYRGQRGGRSEYYELTFAALKSHLSR
jgi:uracil-DNA glycosylase family 4